MDVCIGKNVVLIRFSTIQDFRLPPGGLGTERNSSTDKGRLIMFFSWAPRAAPSYLRETSLGSEIAHTVYTSVIKM